MSGIKIAVQKMTKEIVARNQKESMYAKACIALSKLKSGECLRVDAPVKTVLVIANTFRLKEKRHGRKPKISMSYKHNEKVGYIWMR